MDRRTAMFGIGAYTMRTFAPRLARTTGASFQPWPQVVSLNIGAAHGLTYDPTVGLLIVGVWDVSPGVAPSGLVGINPLTGAIAWTLALGALYDQIRDVEIGPDGNWWASNQTGNVVYKIAPSATAPNVLATIAGFNQPYWFCAGPSKMYVTCTGDGTFKQVDPAINTIVASLTVGQFPMKPDYDGSPTSANGAGPQIWLPCFGGNEYWSITESTFSVVGHYSTTSWGTSPYAVCCTGPDAIFSMNSGQLVRQSTDWSTSALLANFGNGKDMAPLAVVDDKVLVCLATGGTKGKGGIGIADLRTATSYGVIDVYAPETNAGHPSDIVQLPNGDCWVCLGGSPVRVQLFRLKSLA